MPTVNISIAGQIFSQRHFIMMGAFVILVVLNIWRWWPVSEVGINKGESPREISMTEKEVNFLNFIKPEKKEVTVTRNLFVPVVKKVSYRKPVEVTNKTKAPAIKAEKQQSVLNAFKLEGILDTEGRMQAFLSRQDDVFMVYGSERVVSTIIVEKITHDRILLKDEASGASQWISLGGD